MKQKEIYLKRRTRYATDPVYRQNLLNLVKIKREENKQYPVYVDLIKVRNSLWNFKESIEHHKRRIKLAQNRIYKATRRKEILEMEWGKLRAELKKKKKAEKHENINRI